MWATIVSLLIASLAVFCVCDPSSFVRIRCTDCALRGCTCDTENDICACARDPVTGPQTPVAPRPRGNECTDCGFCDCGVESTKNRDFPWGFPTTKKFQLMSFGGCRQEDCAKVICHDGSGHQFCNYPIGCMCPSQMKGL
ncbi:uncharacterized protein LOC129597423 [Paramacrobiotus metropolitanus]|uniref:uncharacterized protein LOC129597423 n=1 Tax=Paramacrobiotus metropolitanus TaxID=2943436 RepID=UPI002445831D|nr:uncharacterized protein LOC129597423 [Paramacrobiotus metropolitanus]